MNVIYLPLEPYPERYTELLTNWTIRRLQQRNVPFRVISGQSLGSGIRTGRVLDAHGRAHWALTQMAELTRYLQDNPTDLHTVIYFDDMFTPGYEALPYILDQLDDYATIVARNHAQSVDPDDFVFPMRRWMRPFEHLVYHSASAIVCASTVHREMMDTAMLGPAKVHVLGLPYDEDDVASRGPINAAKMKRQVIYASRFDAEKQPHFFLDVVENLSSCDFIVCTGGQQLRSNDASAVRRAGRLAERGRLKIYTGCSKADYYRHLAESEVQLNTARQDFISYTAIEASTFGVPTLAPAFRSFPECLENNPRQLYVPWSVSDCVERLEGLLETPEDPAVVHRLSAQQHRSLDRIIDLFERSAT